jgi:hypothetical protein
MAYTLGPLTTNGPSPGIQKGFDDGGDYAIVDKHGHIIGEAIHRVSYHVDADAEANAQLWSAAPDLLEACKALANEVRGICTLLKEQPEVLGWTNIACLETRLKNLDAAIARAKP